MPQKKKVTSVQLKEPLNLNSSILTLPVSSCKHPDLGASSTELECFEIYFIEDLIRQVADECNKYFSYIPSKETSGISLVLNTRKTLTVLNFVVFLL